MLLINVFNVVLCLSSVLLLVKCNTCNECHINLRRDLSNLQPLLLNANYPEILYPKLSDGGVLKLITSDKILFYCNEFEQIYSACLFETFFEIIGSETEFDIANYSCDSLPEHTARRTGNTCGSDSHKGTEIEIGFEISGGNFIRLMRVCHDEDAIETFYVHYEQRPEHLNFQRNFPRPRFIQGKFHSHLNMDRLFTRREQRRTIARILRSEHLADRFIHETNDFFLARGHLAAMSDFIYGSEQDATFYFLNVAPQWQMFNGGNWAIIERTVKQFVAIRNINTEIYTGTYGVLQLPDEYGTYHEIFLGDRNQIPVPKFYYKIVIDRSANSGVVFIGVNNLYVTIEDIQLEYIICEDVSEYVDWFAEDWQSIRRGYSYACRVNDFIRVVTHFNDNDGLDKISNLLL